MSKAKGLGRGIDALLGDNFDNSILGEKKEQIEEIALSQILAMPGQPRQVFDESALEELAASIKQHGVLQPIIVTPLGENTYEIVAGERRLRASQIAGKKTIPAIVRTHQKLERLELALVENVQRVDLSPLEQAASIRTLHEEFTMGYGTIAKRLGKAETTVVNLLRLLQLPKSAVQSLWDKRITEGHARAILALKDYSDEQEKLLRHCEDGWSVRKAEAYVRAVKADPTPKAAIKKIAAETPATKKLAKLLDTKVTLKQTARGGKIEISYRGDDELQRLLEQLSK